MITPQLRKYKVLMSSMVLDLSLFSHLLIFRQLTDIIPILIILFFLTLIHNYSMQHKQINLFLLH